MSENVQVNETYAVLSRIRIPRACLERLKERADVIELREGDRPKFGRLINEAVMMTLPPSKQENAARLAQDAAAEELVDRPPARKRMRGRPPRRAPGRAGSDRPGNVSAA